MVEAEEGHWRACWEGRSEEGASMTFVARGSKE